MLSILITCGVSLPQTCNGKLQLVVASTAMNPSLNVWMACSTALTLWLWGSTSCSLHSSPGCPSNLILACILSVSIHQNWVCMHWKCLHHPHPWWKWQKLHSTCNGTSLGSTCYRWMTWKESFPWCHCRQCQNGNLQMHQNKKRWQSICCSCCQSGEEADDVGKCCESGHHSWLVVARLLFVGQVASHGLRLAWAECFWSRGTAFSYILLWLLGLDWGTRG